jgi:predicted nucleotidyltransferase
MTSYWGPLGWMTLHSVSCIYPDSPKQEDKQIVAKFINLFQETITCPTCKTHFESMVKMYKQKHPEWLDSKVDFFIFVCRAHNTVNNRVDKPRIQTVSDCLKLFQTNVTHTSAYQFRQNYLTYLTRNWTREQSGEGYMRMAMVNEMKKINDQYWTPREFNVHELKISSNANVLEFILQDPAKYSVSPSIPVFANNPNIQIGFKNGRLKLGGR